MKANPHIYAMEAAMAEMREKRIQAAGVALFCFFMGIAPLVVFVFEAVKP